MPHVWRRKGDPFTLDPISGIVAAIVGGRHTVLWSGEVNESSERVGRIETKGS